MPCRNAPLDDDDGQRGVKEALQCLPGVGAEGGAGTGGRRQDTAGRKATFISDTVEAVGAGDGGVEYRTLSAGGAEGAEQSSAAEKLVPSTAGKLRMNAQSFPSLLSAAVEGSFAFIDG